MKRSAYFYQLHINIKKLNTYYQAILYLQARVKKMRINHELRRCYDGWNLILLDDDNNIVGNIMEHCFSDGHEDDLMEAFGFPECKDDSICYLHLNECLKLINNNFKEN